MSITGIKKDIEQLKKAATLKEERIQTPEEFWEDINKERVSEGKRPVIHIEYNLKGHMVCQEFYEVNIPKIDEYRISEGKEPLFPMYLAGEYEIVKTELLKYDANFLRKMPPSTILDERLQPLADACSFDHIDYFNEAERLFMQDQQLYHLHHKPELGEEFIKYLMSERENEGANQLSNNNIIKVTTEQIIPEKIRKYLEPIGSFAGEYRFTMAVQEMKSFIFEDSISVPGQIITLSYTPTSEYKGEWSAEYSHTGKILPIHNINLWVWLHQRDINRKIHGIVKERGENEPAAVEKGN